MFKKARSPARPSRDNAVDEVSRHLRGGDAKRRAMLSSHLLQPPQVELCVMELPADCRLEFALRDAISRRHRSFRQPLADLCPASPRGADP